MWYLYVLRNRKKKTLFIGSTKDLDQSMAEHACGMYDETADAHPLTCELYIGLETKKQAESLEKYLRTPAGKALLQQRFLKK